MAYEDEKVHSGKAYRGMKVGGVHLWTYPDGKWTERKVTPQRWEVAFTSLKRRRRRAPQGSGVEVGSGYHWLVVAHQWVGKLDANTYATHLEGSKHLVAFRKPGWKGWTTQQRGHTSARLKTIAVLEELLEELRDRTDDEFEDPRDDVALASLLSAAEGTASPTTREGEALPAPGTSARTPRTPDAAARAGAKRAAKGRRRAVSRPARVRRERRARRAVAPAATRAPRRSRR